jgi:hypothetical protein
VRGRKENPRSLGPADRLQPKWIDAVLFWEKPLNVAPSGKGSGFCGGFRKNEAFHEKSHYGPSPCLAVQFVVSMV